MSRDVPDLDHQSLPSPNGCRWCGVDERDHAQRWKPPVGWHRWVEPTSDQRKERMRERRDRRARRQDPEARATPLVA
jgi:hypothetical protein